MAGTVHRRLWVLCGAAALAVTSWLALPGTAIDRAAFTAVIRAFANPPLFVAGKGSHNQPWQLRTLNARNPTAKHQGPVVVSLGDDRNGFFQSSPPSPIDLAVVLTNFQRLGSNKAAAAVVLAWDAPDPIGLAALDQALRRFDALVMTAPLSRGPVPEPMPPAFRKASIPLENVRGDRALLPVVNRIPLPGVIFGGVHTLAGFQVLDAEPATRFAPLLARWDDRVVFAFPLLCVLQRLDLTVSAVQIRLGESIQLGPGGPIVPIDRYGRMTVPLKPLAPYAQIPAEALIDGAAGLIPPDAPPPVVLRDDRSGAEPATRAFSAQLPAVIAALASDAGLAPARDYARLPATRELGLLLLAALVLTALCALPEFPRHTAFLTVTGACLGAQFLAAGCAGLWLPGLAVLAAIAAAAVLSALVAVRPAAPLPQAVTVPPPDTKPVPHLAAHPAPSPAPHPAPPVISAPAPAKQPARKPRPPGKKRRR